MLPDGLAWTLGGIVATLRARPNAPGKELLSLITKVPGSLSFNNWIAENIFMIIKLQIDPIKQL